MPPSQTRSLPSLELEFDGLYLFFFLFVPLSDEKLTIYSLPTFSKDKMIHIPLGFHELMWPKVYLAYYVFCKNFQSLCLSEITIYDPNSCMGKKPQTILQGDH